MASVIWAMRRTDSQIFERERSVAVAGFASATESALTAPPEIGCGFAAGIFQRS